MTSVVVVPSDLRRFAQEIVRRGWTEKQWSEHESDDEFQAERVEGGFDATEMAFCFSVYDEDEREWWVQLTMPAVEALAAGSVTEVPARCPT